MSNKELINNTINKRKPPCVHINFSIPYFAAKIMDFFHLISVAVITISGLIKPCFLHFFFLMLLCGVYIEMLYIDLKRRYT